MRSSQGEGSGNLSFPAVRGGSHRASFLTEAGQHCCSTGFSCCRCQAAPEEELPFGEHRPPQPTLSALLRAVSGHLNSSLALE